MKISELNDYLSEYIVNDTIKSLLIDGDWGIGKTYTITQFLKSISSNKNIKAHYCSLFGCTDIGTLHQQLYAKFHPHKVRSLKALSYVPIAVNLTTTFGFGTGIDTSKITDDIVATQINKSIKVKEKTCLIVFDDLERITNNPTITMEELLGYFNRLRAENIKIIVICNKEKIACTHLNIFNEFKEKVFDRSINIESCDGAVINEFFGDNYKYIKNETLNLINNNLRTAYKISIFFNEAQAYLKTNNINIDSEDLIFICTNIILEFFTNTISEIYTAELNERLKSDSYSSALAKLELEKQNSDEFKITAISRNITKYSITVDSSIINSLYRLFVYLDKSSIKQQNVNKNRFNEDKVFFLSDKNKIKYIEDKIKILSDTSKHIADYEIVKEIDSWLRYCPSYFTTENLNDIVNRIMKISETKTNNNIVTAFLNHEYVFEKKNKSISNFYELLKTKNKEKQEKWCIDYFKSIVDNLNNYSGQLSRLQHFLRQNQLSIPNELVEIIIKNNFYIPDLSEDINENLWDFCHSICYFVVDEMPENKVLLKNYLLSLIDNNDSKCLSERVHSLIDYSIDKVLKNK